MASFSESCISFSLFLFPRSLSGGSYSASPLPHFWLIFTVRERERDILVMAAPKQDEFQPHPVKEQLPGVEFCITSPPPWCTLTSPYATLRTLAPSLPSLAAFDGSSRFHPIPERLNPLIKPSPLSLSLKLLSFILFSLFLFGGYACHSLERYIHRLDRHGEGYVSLKISYPSRFKGV